MTSVAAKPAADTMSNPSTFSYAQAARGVAVVPLTTAQPDSPAASAQTSSASKDGNNSPQINVAVSDATSSTMSDTQELSKALQESTDLSNARSTESEISSVVGSIGSNGALAGSQIDAVSVTGSQSRGGERGSGHQASRAGDSHDTRKTRKGKKAKGSEKDADQELNKENLKTFEPVKVLSEAPIPTVNIWSQRKEERAAAEAKVAASVPSLAPTVTAPVGRDSTTADGSRLAEAKKAALEESFEPSTGKAGTSGPNSKAAKKSGDAPRPGPGSDGLARRHAPRGSRVPAKEDKPLADVPPMAQDASSWPSIEPSAVEDGKKKPPHDRVDQTEKEKLEEAGTSKPRQKTEWTPLSVPLTYAYDSSVPNRGNPRTRGAGRGGRDAGSRGGHNNLNGATTVPATEKESAAPAAFPPKTPVENKDRPRDNNALPARPATQALSASKRGTDAPSREARKASGVSTSDKPKNEFTTSSVSTRGEVPTRDSRPEHVSNGDQGFNNSRRQSGDRRESRQPHDFHLENPSNHPGRGERSDRGRGGGHRGRGGMGSHHQQQQSGYGQKYFGGNGVASPQHQGTFSPTTNQYPGFSGHNNGNNRGRGHARTHTGPAHGVGPRHPNGNAMSTPGRMSSMPLTANAVDYHPVQQPYPPFHTQGHYPVPNPNETLLTGVREQIEYYFSPHNLETDFFLRANMDSQGWVLLKTIASFKRITILAPAFGFVQAACATSREIEYVTGDDGEDRVRSRGNVSSFILPMNSRVENARSDGPAHFYWRSHDHMTPYMNGYGPPSMYAASPSSFQPEYPPYNGADRMYPGHMYHPHGDQFTQNGVNGTLNGGSINGEVNGYGYANGHPRPAGESQLSAAVPDFSPMPPRPTLAEFQQFRDEDIPGVNVLLNGGKKPTVAASTNGATVVNGFTTDGDSPAAKSVANGVTDKTSRPEGSADQAAPGSTKYPDLREMALDQRKKAASGETPAAMLDLYAFLSEFLSRSFNTKLYNEFRQLALEDATSQPASVAGLKRLLSFYEAVFDVKPSYPREFDEHCHEAKAILESPGTGPNGMALA